MPDKRSMPRRKRGQLPHQDVLHGPDEKDRRAEGASMFGVAALMLASIGLTTMAEPTPTLTPPAVVSTSTSGGDAKADVPSVSAHGRLALHGYVRWRTDILPISPSKTEIQITSVAEHTLSTQTTATQSPRPAQSSVADWSIILAGLSLLADVIFGLFPDPLGRRKRQDSMTAGVNAIIDDIASPLVRSFTPRKVLGLAIEALERMKESAVYISGNTDARLLVDLTLSIAKDLYVMIGRRSRLTSDDVRAMILARIPQGLK